MAKSFTAGQVVEVVRDTYPWLWEPATYRQAAHDFRGWHVVELGAFKERVLVPARRIRAKRAGVAKEGE